MDQVTLDIFECKPGMKIAETLHNNYGAVLIMEGAILDKQVLNRMEEMGQLQIKVFVQDTDAIRKNYQVNIQDKYTEIIQEIRNNVSKVKIGAALDMTKVRNITDSIYSGVYSIRDMIGPLSSIGTVVDYNYTHSMNVSILATTIGKWMNCSERTIKHLTQAGLLHDIGKCKIPKSILNKPDELTDDEFKMIKQHPIYAYNILKDVTTIHSDVLQGVLTHHEREDGSGYPKGITSERINLIAKIVAVADIYDAMTSDRVYRKKESPFEVFELMQNGSFGKLHPIILNTFIKNMGAYYTGAQVALNNNIQGEVVFINANSIARPIIKTDDGYIDLSHQRDLKIEKILTNNIDDQ